MVDANPPNDDRAPDEKRHDEDKPSRLSKTWVRVGIFLVVVLVLGGFWLYRYRTHGRFVQETNDAYFESDDVVMSSQVAGTVQEVFVTDHQQVHVGDRLARIDSRRYAARVDQAKAQAAQGRATIAVMP